MKYELSKTANENKEKFIAFMRLIGLSETSINIYSGTLLICSELICDKLQEKGYSNLYEVTNQGLVRYYQQLLESNKVYIKRNHTGNNRYMASVANYVKYVDFLYVFGRK